MQAIAFDLIDISSPLPVGPRAHPLGDMHGSQDLDDDRGNAGCLDVMDCDAVVKKDQPELIDFTLGVPWAAGGGHAAKSPEFHWKAPKQPTSMQSDRDELPLQGELLDNLSLAVRLRRISMPFVLDR